MPTGSGDAPIPFLDLAAQDAEMGTALRDAATAVLDSRQFILGPHLARFEAAMAAYCGVPHAIGVASGTDALALALAALGVGPGVIVLTTPFSFFATASAIVRLGARPVFADIDPETFNLAPAAVDRVLERAPGPVAGILPVHLFGRLAPMDALGTLAARHGCWLLEDAAQAVGARSAGRAAGAMGRAGCLSFYPTKNLGAAGDGGMVVTADDALAARVRQDRHQGQTAAYVHGSIGLCSRLDAIQAAILGAKLPHLDAWNAGRRRVAGWYDVGLRDAGLVRDAGGPIVPPGFDGEGHVFHQYVVRAARRDALAEHLARSGIGTQVYYRTPLHRQPPLADAALVPLPLPEAERASREVLALPIYPQLDEPRVRRWWARSPPSTAPEQASTPAL